MRGFVLDNADQWVAGYGVDALRLDAVQALYDHSSVHILEELATRVHTARPGSVVVAESDLHQPLLVTAYGIDAMWADDLHHALHVALTGETSAWYDGFQGLDGYRHELGIRGVWHRDSWDVTLEYRFDSSDYDDENLSFDRHQLGVDVQRQLDENWSVQGGLSFDRSRYDVTENGSEERFELTLGGSRALNETWRVVVRYAFADNSADLPEFNYQRNLFSAGVEAAW